MSCLLLLFKTSVYAEGTKQLEPYNPATNPTEITKIIMDDAVVTGHRILFAQVGCAAQYRLNIHIENAATEKIYIGLNDAAAGLYFQVRNPSGGTPIPLTAVPSSGTGYISSWAQAFAGPNIGGSNPSGYTPIVVTPTMTGDYYIEFAAGSAGGSVSNTALEYFDITVAQGTTPINGRVWSKAWQIKSGGGYNVTPPTTQSFSTFYIYTDDGIVTKLNLNGSCGGTSSIYCNQYGVSNTGNWTIDRKSFNGWPGSDLPQYKIFLNDPDNAAYPTGIPG
ncbi:MAG TPA: hypothetical protein PLP88_04870, partial [Bacteroidales bacterium]|nr:hypothetical protein [Bacteroidales bacterium]